jgi:hypothetical protein
MQQCKGGDGTREGQSNGFQGQFEQRSPIALNVKRALAWEKFIRWSMSWSMCQALGTIP